MLLTDYARQIKTPPTVILACIMHDQLLESGGTTPNTSTPNACRVIAPPLRQPSASIAARHSSAMALI